MSGFVHSRIINYFNPFTTRDFLCAIRDAAANTVIRPLYQYNVPKLCPARGGADSEYPPGSPRDRNRFAMAGYLWGVQFWSVCVLSLDKILNVDGIVVERFFIIS